jgi:hypothetical protein
VHRGGSLKSLIVPFRRTTVRPSNYLHKGKVHLEQVTKAQRGSRGIALLFL